MKYEKTIWKDHIVDVDTKEIIQHGTPQSAMNFNNMEGGIERNDTLARANKSNLTSLAVEVSILKDASLNNMTNNVFFENFENTNSIIIENGIYDQEGKRLYA